MKRLVRGARAAARLSGGGDRVSREAVPTTLDKFISNEWAADASGAFERADILRHDRHPEGLDVFRLRFSRAGVFELPAALGHILSPIDGEAHLSWEGHELSVVAGRHVFLPRGVQVRAEAGFSAVVVSGADPSQTAGERLVVRDEECLRCCAADEPLRWILTPQYLSRRVFLHHDRTLLSKAGHPISWFRTTMFDVRGLPPSDDGQPVFRMSYNYRTEPNILVDVRGRLRVRTALHPYRDKDQKWDSWRELRSDDTYHLNEAAGGPEEEWVRTERGLRARRNKHEVSVQDGYATLFCIFDPAPTGVEQHHAGAYSDYGPLEESLGTPAYAAHLEKMRPLDEMLDVLSLHEAMGDVERTDGARLAAQEGRRAQLHYEAMLHRRLRAEAPERAAIIRPWMTEVDGRWTLSSSVGGATIGRGT